MPVSHSATVVGRGDSARSHIRTSHGSLLEPAVTSLATELAPGSLDDIDEDVDRPSLTSSAAAKPTGKPKHKYTNFRVVYS